MNIITYAKPCSESKLCTWSLHINNRITVKTTDCDRIIRMESGSEARREINIKFHEELNDEDLH